MTPIKTQGGGSGEVATPRRVEMVEEAEGSVVSNCISLTSGVTDEQ